LRDAVDDRPALAPLGFRVADNEDQPRGILNSGAIFRERNDWNIGAAADLRLDELADRGLDLVLFVKRGPAVGDDLL
jgi:hypothetical protein